MLVDTLTYRTIELPKDSARVVTYHRDACCASFGPGFEARLEHPAEYLTGLAARVEEFPDGHLLAFAGARCVGQLELQVPYGLDVGYVNLFYVTPAVRRKGYGRVLHARAERYFRSWEAREVHLHVSPENVAATEFYRSMGYRFVRQEGEMARLVKRL